MRIIASLFFCAAVTLLCSPGFAADGGEDPVVIEVQQLRRPQAEFLAHGDVIGISEALLDRMGIEEGDEVFVQTPLGGVFAFRTKIYGTYEDRIYAKKTLRETMNVLDGRIRLRLAPAVWGDGPEQEMTGRFTEVVRPPEAFLEYGDAVGISTQALLAAGIPPGWKGTLQGPEGTVEVTIQLLDRGVKTIAMQKSLRDHIGVSDGPAEVTLRVHAKPAPGEAAHNESGDS
jgi:hypothetical protein